MHRTERQQVIYKGRVQGVGFRATARHIARHHQGITGWVRNNPDASVTLQAQGSPQDIQNFLSAIRARQAALIVSEQATPIPSIEHEHSFEIIR